jgi:gas vesicle protein
MDKKTGRFALGALLLGVAGYVAGILTAPKSGKETRKDIKDAANQKVAELEKKLKSAHTELNDLMGKATDRAKTARGKAKEEADSLLEKAKKAKEKARLALSSTHEEGAGGVIGATLVVALLIWLLSLFDNVPLIGHFVETIRNTIQRG